MYKARLLLRTGAGLVTDRGWERLEQLFADDRHAPVEIMWGVHQKIMAPYRAKTPAEGKQLMSKVIDSLTTGVPEALEELKSLGKTLAQRRKDILACYRPPRHLQRAHRSSQRPAWSTYAASPSDSETQPTTPYAASSTPEASDNSYYTPKREEPICRNSPAAGRPHSL